MKDAERELIEHGAGQRPRYCYLISPEAPVGFRRTLGIARVAPALVSFATLVITAHMNALSDAMGARC